MFNWTRVSASLRLPALLLAGIAAAAPANGDELNTPPLLPRGLEIELALSGLPEAARADATVMALERGGYVAARHGNNGFTCLVRRSGAVPGTFSESILPICYDAEGSRTLLPAVLEEVRLLEAGESAAAVKATIDTAWKSGTFSTPGPGVAYMLSPVFCLRGQCGGYVPHTMFYAPYKTDIEVAANEDLFDHVPSLQAPGSPGCMMVIPVGATERAGILSAGARLVDQAEAFLGGPNQRP